MDGDLFNVQIDSYSENEEEDATLTDKEIAKFIEITTKLGNNISFFESSKCRELRKNLHPLVDNLRKKSFGGKTRSDYEEKKMIYKDHLGRIARQKAQDAKYVNSVKLREERLKKLKVLLEENADFDVPFIPDGTADDMISIQDTPIESNGTNFLKLIDNINVNEKFLGRLIDKVNMDGIQGSGIAPVFIAKYGGGDAFQYIEPTLSIETNINMKETNFYINDFLKESMSCITCDSLSLLHGFNHDALLPSGKSPSVDDFQWKNVHFLLSHIPPPTIDNDADNYFNIMLHGLLFPNYYKSGRKAHQKFPLLAIFGGNNVADAPLDSKDNPWSTNPQCIYAGKNEGKFTWADQHVHKDEPIDFGDGFVFCEVFFGSDMARVSIADPNMPASFWVCALDMESKNAFLTYCVLLPQLPEATSEQRKQFEKSISLDIVNNVCSKNDNKDRDTKVGDKKPLLFMKTFKNIVLNVINKYYPLSDEKNNVETNKIIAEIWNGFCNKVPSSIIINYKDLDENNKKINASCGTKQNRPKVLYKARSCYVCKRRYTVLHTFYDMLCQNCAQFNFEKRKQTFDLTGFTCLITGGRVKIGYQVVLKLLRAGAHCIVTTRFPKDCALRYAAAEGASDWFHRLDIFGLDFRDIQRLEQFCIYLISTYEKLDIIINNACQTIRRPIMYYTPLLKTEMGDINKLSLKNGNMNNNSNQINIGNSLNKQNQFEKVGSVNLLGSQSINANGINVFTPSSQLDATLATHLKKMLNSAEQSQIVIVKEDLLSSEKEFPKDILDVNGQQIDLRKTNTWITPMEDVEIGEATEVFAINTLAPFLINSKLIPLLEKGNENKKLYKFIVNVSAMEGKFNRVKSGYHPHTNMAKAALNMMTKTSSKKLKVKNIFMTSVDTGWINEENPLEKASKYAAKHNFQTPLDEIDAASRILDPVFNGLKTKDPQFGIFYKDYHETEW